MCAGDAEAANASDSPDDTGSKSIRKVTYERTVKLEVLEDAFLQYTFQQQLTSTKGLKATLKLELWSVYSHCYERKLNGCDSQLTTRRIRILIFTDTRNEVQHRRNLKKFCLLQFRTRN